MNVNEAQEQAAKIAKQLGWEKFGTEKKLYQASGKRVISQAQEEFFILLSPETSSSKHTLHTRYGEITSERGSYGGFDTSIAKNILDQNFYFAGTVTISGTMEASEVLFPFLRVYKVKD